MSVSNPQNYRDLLRQKTQVLVRNIAAIEKGARAAGGSEETVFSMCAPYYEMLRNINADEFPLATALDESDLVVILNGPAVEREHPRLSLITSYFTKVRTQVTKLTKELANIAQSHTRLPREMDLELSAYGRGSLILGFSLPPASGLDENETGQQNLLGDQDPLYKAAKEAMRTLGVVSYHVSSGHSMEEIAQEISDGKVRDIAISALQDLAPTGRIGVSSVTLTGKQMDDKSASLTPQIRKIVSEALRSPVIGDEFAELIGYVREIDLDAKRFELRHIEHNEINDVRCVYSSYGDSEASKWVNEKVGVFGRVERDNTGKARLIDIDKVELRH